MSLSLNVTKGDTYNHAIGIHILVYQRACTHDGSCPDCYAGQHNGMHPKECLLSNLHMPYYLLAISGVYDPPPINVPPLELEFYPF